MLDLNDAYQLPIDVLRFLVWNADDDLAQATWEWPPKPIGPGYAITVLQRQDERKAVWLGGYDFEGGYLAVP